MGRGESNNKVAVSQEDWSRRLAGVEVGKEDMNRLVMNFLVTEGYVEAARAFERESGTAPGCDLAASADRMAIRQAVQRGEVEAAVERVNDLNPEILERDAALAFRLQQQRLIELVRGGQLAEALEYAQDYLAPRGEDCPALLEELERTVSLLVFEDAAGSPAGELLAPAQRQRAASELNAAILASQCQEPEPRLPRLLRLLVWAQGQLDERAAYPRIAELAAAHLVPPPT